MRRLRATGRMRDLVREVRLDPKQFILPLFVCSGEGVRKEIGAMPNNFQLSLDELIGEEHVIRHAGGESIAIPLPHPSGASSWIHEPGHAALLDRALARLQFRLAESLYS